MSYRTLLACGFALFVPALVGQSRPTPKFEVASLRLAAPADSPWDRLSRGTRTGGPGTPDPQRVSFSNVPLDEILAEAFDVPAHRISGADWIVEAHYDIKANLPAGTTTEQSREMLRNLLIERLHLTAHFETSNVAGYELRVATTGAKLKPAEADPDTPVSLVPPLRQVAERDEGFPELPSGVRQVMTYARFDEILRARFASTSIEELTRFLGDRLSTEMTRVGNALIAIPAAVADKTGLTGRYDFTLQYKGWVKADVDPGVPSAVKSALEKQLGLTLLEAKVPVKILVIDHIDRIPEDN